jgi:hypothetical protein
VPETLDVHVIVDNYPRHAGSLHGRDSTPSYFGRAVPLMIA